MTVYSTCSYSWSWTVFVCLLLSPPDRVHVCMAERNTEESPRASPAPRISAPPILTASQIHSFGASLRRSLPQYDRHDVIASFREFNQRNPENPVSLDFIDHREMERRKQRYETTRRQLVPLLQRTVKMLQMMKQSRRETECRRKCGDNKVQQQKDQEGHVSSDSSPDDVDRDDGRDESTEAASRDGPDVGGRGRRHRRTPEDKEEARFRCQCDKN